MSSHSQRLALAQFALGIALAGSLAACGKAEEKPAVANDPAAAQQTEGSALATAASGASDATGLVAAVREYAEHGCLTARRALEFCAACDSAEQKSQRDLLLAYCQERESPSQARELYEAIVTSYPHSEASATAIMRVRQIDAAPLSPLSGYAGPKPTPIDRPQPAYPTLAESAGVEGKVRVRFDVREDGGVSNVRVVESTPPLIFDSVALYAVSSWKFQPGQAAESQQITLRFDLTDAEVAAGKAAAGKEAK